MEHYLYTLEFFVENLRVSKPNECAPPEYPTNVEFRFRQGFYCSIPPHQIGSITEQGSKDNERWTPSDREKKGRCCVFTLERPIDDSDYLDVRVYKKMDDRCKFLIGQLEIPLTKTFQELMAKFYAENSAIFYNMSPTLPRRPTEEGTSISPLTPYPPQPTEEGPTEAEIEERKTKKAPDDTSPQFKIDSRKDDFGIHTDKTPFVPEKAVSIMINDTYQLKNGAGESTGFIKILCRLSCLGQVICCNIPYPQGQNARAKNLV